MMIRTFLAIELSEEAKPAFTQLQERLRVAVPSARWVGSANLHITVAFLGDVEADHLGSLIDAVRDSVRTALTFSLEIRGLGAFPSSRRPRVLWAGVTGASLSSLINLRGAVVSACVGVGYSPDDTFHPHITIARFRPGRVPDVSSLISGHACWSAGMLEVDAIVVYASELTLQGPIHRELGRCPLGHPGDSPP